MNNEPVAWINTRISDERPFLDWEKTEEQNYLSVPLYTHPAKAEDEGKVCARCGAIAYDPVITQTAKELTDEEIISTMVQFDVYSSDDHCLIEAGRAILRKAQNG